MKEFHSIFCFDYEGGLVTISYKKGRPRSSDMNRCNVVDLGEHIYYVFNETSLESWVLAGLYHYGGSDAIVVSYRLD